jgi:hypothetical protein
VIPSLNIARIIGFAVYRPIRISQRRFVGLSVLSVIASAPWLVFPQLELDKVKHAFGLGDACRLPAVERPGGAQ